MGDERPSSWLNAKGHSRIRGGIVVWSLIWVLSFLAADLAFDSDWIEGEPAALPVIAGVTLLGVGWVLSYRRFLRSTDELIRRIHMDALAWAVGAGFVSAFTHSLLQAAELVTKSPTVVIPVAMTAAYIVAVLVGYRRYS